MSAGKSAVGYVGTFSGSSTLGLGEDDPEMRADMDVARELVREELQMAPGSFPQGDANTMCDWNRRVNEVYRELVAPV